MWRWGQVVLEQPSGLLALLLIPLVVLLHWLQLERQERTVPGLYLWRRLSRRLPRRSFWRQLLTNPSFWLQAAAAVLFTVLLAKPGWQPPREHPHEWIVVVDRSASLSASFNGSLTRDQALRRELEDLSEETSSGTRWTLVSAGPSPQVVARDVDPAAPQGLAVLAQLPPPGGVADWEATGRLVAAISSTRASAVLVVTDESITRAELDRFFPQPYRLINLPPASGQVVANLGIVRLEVQPVSDSVTSFQALGVIANGGQAPTDFTLQWYNADRLLATDRGTIGPGEQIQLVHQVTLLPGTALRLELVADGPDLLAYDDEAYAVTLPLRNVRVLLYAPGESALARALLAAPRLVLVERAAAGETLGFTARDWSDYDLVVFDRVPPPVRPPLPTVTVGVAPEATTALLTSLELAAIGRGSGQAVGRAAGVPADQGLSLGPAAGVPVDQSMDERHPLSRYVPWDEIRLFDNPAGGGTRTWSPWPLLPGALPLWQVREGTLVQVAAGLPPRVIVAFDLYDSDWPQRISFPVWVKNLLDWALPWAARPIGPILRPGEPLPDWFLGAAGVHPGTDTGDPGWEIVRPDGSLQTLPPELPLSAYRLPPDAPPGAYWLRRQGGQVLAGWSVSLLAEQETELVPSDASAAGTQAGNQPSEVRTVEESVSPRTTHSHRPLLAITGTLLLILILGVELAVALWESRPLARPRIGSSRSRSRSMGEAKGGAPGR